MDKITLGELRRFIRSRLVETGGGSPHRTLPYDVTDAASLDSNDVDQVGPLASLDGKDVDDGLDVDSHLRDVTLTPEETWGPVPPTAQDPYVTVDPLTNDYGVLPTPPIRR